MTTSQFSELAHAIMNECDRLGWSNWQRSQFFWINYQVRSPWVLNEPLLQQALGQLQDLG